MNKDQIKEFLITLRDIECHLGSIARNLQDLTVSEGDNDHFLRVDGISQKSDFASDLVDAIKELTTVIDKHD